MKKIVTWKAAICIHTQYLVFQWQEIKLFGKLTRIFAQASWVDSVPLSSFISIEPKYWNKKKKINNLWKTEHKYE